MAAVTFSDISSALRNEILQEAGVTFYSDSQLLTFCYDASKEIAGAASIPEATSATSVAISASTITSPTSTLAVKSVVLGGLQLSPASLSEVKAFQSYAGIPRFFNFNPARGGNIQIGPPADQSGTATVEYVQDLSATTYSGGDQPWGGKLGEWTDLIKYYAAAKAFEMSLEYSGQKATYQLEPSGDKAFYWMTRYRQRLVEFGQFLGNTDIVKELLVQNPRSYVRDTTRMMLREQQTPMVAE